MDIKLENGDFALGPSGLPISLSGREELIQQAMIRLTIRRGSLSSDPELGSNFYRLQASSANLDRTAFAFAQEALAPLDAVSVREVSCLFSPQFQRLTVSLQLETNSEYINMEVTL